MFFEELGFTYLGPIDGHNFEELLENLQYAKKMKVQFLFMSLRKKEKAINLLRTIKSVHGMEQDHIKWKQVTLLNHCK